MQMSLRLVEIMSNYVQAQVDHHEMMKQTSIKYKKVLDSFKQEISTESPDLMETPYPPNRELNITICNQLEESMNVYNDMSNNDQILENLNLNKIEDRIRELENEIEHTVQIKTEHFDVLVNQVEDISTTKSRENKKAKKELDELMISNPIESLVEIIRKTGSSSQNRESINNSNVASNDNKNNDSDQITEQDCVSESSFSETSNAEKSEKKYNRKKPAERECRICGKFFARSGGLKVHMGQHTGERPYKCSACPKSFLYPSNLSVHAKCHTGEKKFQCLYCPKSFVENNKLRRHTLIHTGEKPFKCKYCIARFTQSGDLKIHVRLHTGEKPYKCQFCGERFRVGQDLTLHEKIHTLPYKCDQCSSAYQYHCQLKSHTKHKHKRIYQRKKFQFRCKECNKDFELDTEFKAHMKKYHLIIGDKRISKNVKSSMQT